MAATKRQNNVHRCSCFGSGTRYDRVVMCVFLGCRESHLMIKLGWWGQQVLFFWWVFSLIEKELLHFFGVDLAARGSYISPGKIIEQIPKRVNLA